MFKIDKIYFFFFFFEKKDSALSLTVTVKISLKYINNVCWYIFHLDL